MSEPVVNPAEGRRDYLNVDYGVKTWLLTVDHKRIALLYLVSVTIMFVLGGLFAAGIRLELLTPAGDVVQADTYNKLFTMHGVMGARIHIESAADHQAWIAANSPVASN